MVLLVPAKESLTYWKKRFEHFGVKHDSITTYAGKEALPFEDSEGLRLVLLNNNGEKVPNFWTPWEDSTVEEAHRILGMGSTEITVRHLDKTASTLKDMFGYVEVSRSADEAIFQAVKGESFGEIVIKEQDGPLEKSGRGSIHHIAIRVKNEEELHHWGKIVKENEFSSSGIVDRFYFHSLYFRDRNGILFEIATDGPGFTRDSSIEDLGKTLDLPEFLEDRRAEIEAKLEPID